MPIDYQKEGKIAIFTINRPEVLNALSPQALAEWTDALIDFRDNPDLWVGIITGAGEKAFCTGLDLRGGQVVRRLEARQVEHHLHGRQRRRRRWYADWNCGSPSLPRSTAMPSAAVLRSLWPATSE